MPEIHDEALKASHNRCLIARKDERLSAVLARLQVARGQDWWHLIVDWGNDEFRAITFAGLAKQLAKAPGNKVLEPLSHFDLPAAIAVDKFSRGTAAAEDLARQQPNDLVVVTQKGRPIGLLWVGNTRSTRSVEDGPSIADYYVNRINTGGGAYIEGSVHTGGGDFVGRDKKSSE